MSETLRSLSDQEIISRTHALTTRERKLTLTLLLHLNEIERRKLHLKRGYASMFDYCTSGLVYSSSAAYRRIQTARCIARFPGLYEMLERNEVNLSTIAQASRVLNDANYQEVISRMSGKSQREVEAILAEYQLSATPRDRARTVVVRVPNPLTEPVVKPIQGGSAASAGVAAMGRTEANPTVACENSAYCRNGSECAGAPTNESSVPVPPVTRGVEKRVVLQFSVHPEFMAKLERVRSLAWHRLPANASFEQVLEVALDLFIDRKDPHARGRRREEQTRGTATRKAPGEHTLSPFGGERHIPVRVRYDVFARDRGQCTYVGANGRRCASTSALQVDHIKPVARGGSSTLDNLRLLCASHNRLEAERLMGVCYHTAPG